MNMPAQGTDQWHAARKGRITASVIGKVITGNGEDDVLRDMVRDALGYPRAFTGNVATEYGHANEDIARTEYAMETGRSPVETGFHTHPKHDWLGASPDGLVGDDGLIEIKAPFKLRDALEVPDELLDLGDRDLYWHQIQCQMAVMGRDWCDFAVWCPGEIKVKRYHRDNVWIGTATDTCLPWLEYLKDVLADPEEAERVA
uniref:lambda exonuclease family protein n=1 Tax=Halomonas sp. TaxID=1486246 RepID=UPI00356409A8